MKILLVGAGRMGNQLATGWLRKPGQDVSVVCRSQCPLPTGAIALNEHHEITQAEYDAVVLATKPKDLLPAAARYHRAVTPHGALISVAAGVSVASVASAAPGTGVVRLMPNLPVGIGQGMNGLFTATDTSPTTRQVAERVTSPLGEYLWLKEERQLDAFTAVAGSGPAYLYAFLAQYQQAARELGFSDYEAQHITRQTIIGGASLLNAMGLNADEMSAMVASPGGTTEAGLNALNASNELTDRLRACVNAATARATEINRQFA